MEQLEGLQIDLVIIARRVASCEGCQQRNVFESKKYVSMYGIVHKPTTPSQGQDGYVS